MTEDRPLRRGDFVRITSAGITKRAFVGLASENGRSIAVLYDGMLPVGDGYALGFLPLLLDDDGRWREIVRHTCVVVERLTREQLRDEEP